jgi:acetyl-CoA acetyltransferase
MQNQAAVVGIGMTPVGQYPERTAIGLAAEALGAALADSGLARDDIDGFVWNLGRPSGDDYDRTTEALGLRARFVSQTWTHGRFTGTVLVTAALVVINGLADVVVCLGGLKRGAPGFAAHYGTPPHGDVAHYGMGGFADEAALALQRYLHLYRADRERLSDVVLTFRRHATLNEYAMLREPLTIEHYLASPKLVDPLRELDCFPANEKGFPRADLGVCVIVARAEAARVLRQSPVFLLAAQGIQAGREETYFGRPGLGLFSQVASTFSPTPWDRSVYEQAGLSTKDVDGFYTYDAFSPLVWYALERFGHCAPGEAPRWAAAERISVEGTLPTNTNGGLLSEGHTAGWGHVVEMVRQLRHRAGARQIRDAAILQWASVFGDSVLLTNDPSSPRRAVNGAAR